MSNFSDDSTFGKIGENIVANFLKKHKSTIDVIDVSNDKWFNNFDIDFLQITKNGINKIEVKTDRIAHKTGNMVYEFISNKYASSIGCFEKTEADFLFYYLEKTKVLYIFDIQDLRNWVRSNKDNLKIVEMGDCAIGYLIKLKEVNDISIKIKLDN